MIIDCVMSSLNQLLSKSSKPLEILSIVEDCSLNIFGDRVITKELFNDVSE